MFRDTPVSIISIIIRCIISGCRGCCCWTTDDRWPTVKAPPSTSLQLNRWW